MFELGDTPMYRALCTCGWPNGVTHSIKRFAVDEMWDHVGPYLDISDDSD